MAIRVESASHWYTTRGEPKHSVPNASKPGQTRPTTVRDARKLDLVPSVTSVLGVIRRPFLEAWQQTNVLEAAQAFADRGLMIAENHALVEAASKCVSRVAMELGSAYHRDVERLISTLESDVGYRGDIEAMPIATQRAFTEWYRGHKCHMASMEQSFAAYGYGGRIDWTGRALLDDVAILPKFTVLDLKTTRTKPGEKIRCYPEQSAQLAAYASGIGKPDAQRANVYLSTTEPGRIDVIIHDDFEEDYAYFLAAFEMWVNIKNYNPR